MRPALLKQQGRREWRAVCALVERAQSECCSAAPGRLLPVAGFLERVFGGFTLPAI